MFAARHVYRIAVILLALLLFGCESDQSVTPIHVVLPGTQDLSVAAREPQGFVELPFHLLPNMNFNLAASRQYLPPFDADSVEMYLYDGATYYHPVNLCHRMLGFIAAFSSTHDSTFLRRAQKSARRLLQESVRTDSALFAPYWFSYCVHANPGYSLPAPWYSGMAQGEFLEVLTRLYEVTGDSAWLHAADSVFNSLLGLRNPDSPWVVELDCDRYFWIEEYPLPEGMDMTLNGFIAALFGVYDYYRVTADSTALAVYEMSLTTLKAYLPDFRRPGHFSYYCLGHRIVATEGYHRFHCSQLRSLYSITGDIYFSEMAEKFEQDLNHAF